MSDTFIFAVGLLTSLLCGGGLAITFFEIRRIERETATHNKLNQSPPSAR